MGVMQHWAAEHERRDAEARYASWCDWAVSAVGSFGSAAGHKFIKGPVPWQEFQVSPTPLLSPMGSPQHHVE
eukprot:2992000-Alexandrium_andersonii.AAC.1